MPTRSKRFITGVLTGYGSIVVNIIFTMTSVPLALYYLDKEHFGLWALALQVNGYLYLIDLGMNGAVTRIVADYKDDVNGGVYGSHLLTGGLIFFIQGLLITLIGAGFSWIAPVIFAIPPHLAGDFRTVLLLLSATAGASVALRSLGSPLWAFQRADVINGCGSIGLLVTLAMLWLGFKSGWGVISFAIAQIPATIGPVFVYLWICRRNHYYPSSGHWGKPTFPIFKQIFHFGKDNLMITLGAQLINATQIMIVSRILGLNAAATFSISTKFYAMAMQMVNIPIAASSAGLAELHIRGEDKRFVQRYRDLITMTLAMATLIAISLAVGNQSLVSIWTHGAIKWSWICDLLVAVLIVIRNLNGCLIGVFGLLKNWKPVRHIPLLEGIVFIPIAIILTQNFGLIGILIASLLAHLLVTTTLAGRAASRILGPWSDLKRPLSTSLLLICLGAVIACIGETEGINPMTMLALAAFYAILALMMIWKFIIPKLAKMEISARIHRLSPRLGKIVN